jgi:lipid-binding SYLF domain-containing protein
MAEPASEIDLMKKCIRLILANLLLLLATACSTSQIPPSSAVDPALEARARAALQQLYATTPNAKALQTRAKAVHVFPEMLKAGLIVGAEEGNGVMFGADGKVMGYYNATSVSYGLQAGAQSFQEAMFLTTNSAINYLQTSGGWSIGAGPSVVVVDTGVARSLTSTTLQSDVYAFIYGQQGLMAGVGLQGQKISKLNP